MKTRILFTTFLLCVIASASMADEQKALLDSVITETYPSGKTKVEYSYNINGTMQFDIKSIWKTNAWSQISKNDYTYDVYNRILITITSRMNPYTSSFVPSTKYEYAYNDKGDQILCTEYMWDTDHWSTSQRKKSSYTYDTNGRLVSSIDTTFISENVWSQIWKSVLIYDDKEMLLCKETYQWNAPSETWSKVTKSSYTYDADDNLILIMGTNWNETETDWVNSTQEELTYDANGYLLTKILSFWTTENSWQQFDKNYYYYHNFNTALNQLEVSHEPKSTKLLRDGQLFILRDGKTYTVTGQEVK
ncbi:MAG: hypothetical protein IJ882_00560 [Paludibacteraceae bacterium]|nr:hypothetical protein [Paludibacteraceae bacterium]